MAKKPKMRIVGDWEQEFKNMKSTAREATEEEAREIGRDLGLE